MSINYITENVYDNIKLMMKHRGYDPEATLPDHSTLQNSEAQFTVFPCYVSADTGDALVWIAGPVTPVKVGDAVEVSGGIPMVNFRSSTLDRTFDKIQLVSAIAVKSDRKGSSKSAPGGADAGVEPPVSGIEPIEGGHTVGEVISGKASLTGSEVAVRGKGIKINTSVMRRNWLHVSDGTVGPDGEQEVIVTTEDIAAVGSTVVVRGTVATDRDFSSGYNYSVLIEDAKVTAD